MVTIDEVSDLERSVVTTSKLSDKVRRRGPGSTSVCKTGKLGVGKTGRTRYTKSGGSQRHTYIRVSSRT